jgi:dTDP-4-dehydrorhamnose reductase
MNNPTVIIFGSNGMLGSYCTRYLSSFYNVVGVTRKDIDASKCSFNELLDVVNRIKNNSEKNIILNCIGVIKQRTNSTREEFINVNSLFPRMLNDVCTQLNIEFVHVTTDCVFDGKKGVYTETDEHTCTDLYGISKSFGEGNFRCIRTSIIGEEKNNKLSLLEWVKSQNNKTIDGFSHHIWNGITCLQFAKTFHNMISNNVFNDWINGVRHIFSPVSVTKKELVEEIIKAYNLTIYVNKAQFSNIVDRTLSSNYINNYCIPNIQTQLKELYEFKSYPNIFLITSAINPVNKPIDGGYTRSIFSVEQRMEQTLNTIKSIRCKVPDSMCIWVESTILTPEQEQIAKSNCELVFNLSENGLCSMYVNGDNKSLGETMTLYFSLKYIFENDIKFNTISKISGRYYLDDHYKFDFDQDYITCRLFSNSYRQWYSSVLYCVGWNQRWKYLDMLFSALFSMEKKMVNDIEGNMFLLFPQQYVRIKERMGVSGLMSATGELAEH